jgi:hypothetical protein
VTVEAFFEDEKIVQILQFKRYEYREVLD